MSHIIVILFFVFYIAVTQKLKISDNDMKTGMMALIISILVPFMLCLFVSISIRFACLEGHFHLPFDIPQSVITSIFAAAVIGMACLLFRPVFRILKFLPDYVAGKLSIDFSSTGKTGLSGQSGKSKSYVEFISSICRVCGYISRANPEVAPEQLDIVNRLISNTQMTSGMIDEFESGRRDGFDPEQSCATIRKKLKDDDYWEKFISGILIRLVFSDRIMTAEEKTRLFHVADLMNISRSCLNSQISAMECEYKYFSDMRSGQDSEKIYSHGGGSRESASRRKKSASERDQRISSRYEALQILEIDIGADEKQIKDAYLRLMKEYHPDRLKARVITGSLQFEYEEKCKLVTEAYNYLKQY